MISERIERLDQRAQEMAGVIMRLSLEGSDGTLFWDLDQINPGASWKVVCELLFAYLDLADRSARAVLGHQSSDAEWRADFTVPLRECAAEKLITNMANIEDHERIRNYFDEMIGFRLETYARCESVFNNEDGGLHGTVIFELYRNLATFGQETMIAAMSQLKVGAIDHELSRSLSQDVHS